MTTAVTIQNEFEFTPIVDKILCMKNGGTQISIIMLKSNVIYFIFKFFCDVLDPRPKALPPSPLDF